MAKQEPMPKIKKDRRPPHYLFIPNLTRPVSKMVYDSKGYIQNNEYKAETAIYRFEPGRPTAVMKQRHAIMLLEAFADNGIVEVAFRELEPVVEQFHPVNNRRTEIMTGQKYNLTQVKKVVTRRFEPVMNQVIRSGEEIAAELLSMRREEEYDIDVLEMQDDERQAAERPAELDAQLGNLKKSELLKIAVGAGVEVPSKATKEEVIELIRSAREDDADEDKE